MDEYALTSQAVGAALADSLADPDDDAVAFESEGIVHSYALNLVRLETHRDEVAAWIDELPREFLSNVGGGWSFLNLCKRADGSYWTDLHMRVEQLVALAEGLGLASWMVPREAWSSLPGRDAVCRLPPAARIDQRARLRRGKGDMSEMTQGLRDLADWFDAHPEYEERMTPGTFNVWCKTKDELLAFKQVAGATRLDKGAIGSFFWLGRAFGGGIQLEANVPREQACRRVVTGTRAVPEEIRPARVEEVVEWECDPLLRDAEPDDEPTDEQIYNRPGVEGGIGYGLGSAF